jgi:hypothetical protein
MKHMRLYTYIFINNSLNIIERHLRCYINKWPYHMQVGSGPIQIPNHPYCGLGHLGDLGQPVY